MLFRSSTSKLISNDAIKISHFINTNYEEGGDNRDLEKTAQTEYLTYRGKYKESIVALDSLIQNSKPSIADYASLAKAKILLSQNCLEDAQQLLEELRKNSTETYIQAEAIFKLADLKKRTRNHHQALELYKELVSNYSGSIYSVEAGKIYRELEKTMKK